MFLFSLILYIQDYQRSSQPSSRTSPRTSVSSSYSTAGHSSQGGTHYGASANFGMESSGSGYRTTDQYGSHNQQQLGHGYNYGGGRYGAGQTGYTHRSEMEREEHYENGQLVSGRKEEKEWKNDDLVRHDHRTYGQVIKDDLNIIS